MKREEISSSFGTPQIAYVYAEVFRGDICKYICTCSFFMLSFMKKSDSYHAL